MQQIALFQLLLKEVQVRCHVDLGGLGQLARLQEPVKPGQSRRIPAHIVHIVLVAHHIVVKQHGNIPPCHIRIRQVHRGAAAQHKVPFHIPLPFDLVGFDRYIIPNPGEKSNVLRYTSRPRCTAHFWDSRE